MFDQPAFQRAKFRRVRYFVAWNAMDDDAPRLAARAFVKRARERPLPGPAPRLQRRPAHQEGQAAVGRAYRRQIRRLVAYFRDLGVREFGTWNEANHASQPTYRSPTRAADFFREMYRAVKGHCRTCGVVALDVLDQPGVERYMRRSTAACRRPTGAGPPSSGSTTTATSTAGARRSRAASSARRTTTTAAPASG